MFGKKKDKCCSTNDLEAGKDLTTKSCSGCSTKSCSNCAGTKKKTDSSTKKNK